MGVLPESLPYARVRFWRQRRDRAEPQLSFVPVSVSAAAPPGESGTGCLELEVAGVRVHVREGASQEMISRVVRALNHPAAYVFSRRPELMRDLAAPHSGDAWRGGNQTGCNGPLARRSARTEYSPSASRCVPST